ncbi:MAG: four helix bundle protein [Flavobacterium sp.]
MNYVKAHQKLDVWNKAIDLVVDIYETTASFPKYPPEQLHVS